MASKNLSNAVDKAIESLKKPKAVNTNNPVTDGNKTATRRRVQVQRARNAVNDVSNTHLHNVPSPLGGTIGDDIEVKNEIRYQMLTGKASDNHIEKSNNFNNIMLNSFTFDSKEEYEQWRSENMIKVVRRNEYGEPIHKHGAESYEWVMKKNAQPPKNFTEEEKKVWDYNLKFGNAYSATYTELARQQREKEKMTADFSDYAMSTHNSYADVVRSFANDLFSAEVNFGEAAFNLVKNAWDYNRQYVFNPLRSGSFGTLLMNTLVNLGETFDLAAVGVRAITGSNTTVYGSGTKLVEGQDYWVYSGGKANQKKLIELGALELINKGSEKRVRRRGGYDPEKIEQNIKNAGLWDEYLKFKEEYDKPSLGGGTPLEVLKETYTSHENYNMDTGNVAADLLLETALDPTLIAGSFIKGISKGIAKEVPEVTLKSLLTEVKNGSPRVNTLLRDFANYKAIQGVKALDKGIDLADSIALKSVFAAPYLGIKGPKTAYKYLRNHSSTFADFVKKQKLSRVISELPVKEGSVSITSAAEVLEKMGKANATTFSDKSIDESFELLHKRYEIAKQDFDQLAYDFTNSKIDVRDMVQILDNKISDITDGDIIDVSTFKEYLEQSVKEYVGQRSDIGKLSADYYNAVTRVTDKIDIAINYQVEDFYSRLGKVTDEASFNTLYTEALEYTDVLPAQFYSDLNTLSVRFDEEVLDDILCAYDLRNNHVTTNVSTSIVDDFSEVVLPGIDDAILKGDVDDNFIRMVDEAKINFDFESELLKGHAQFETVCKSLRNYFNGIVNGSIHTNARTFINMCKSYEKVYNSNKIQQLISLGSKSELNSFEELNKKLKGLAAQVTEQYLSTAVKRDSHIIKTQVDKLALTDQFLSNPGVREVLSVMSDSNNPFGKLLNDISKGAKYDENTLGIPGLAETCETLVKERDAAEAIITLQNDLAVLPDVERFAVLETLFGITKGSPSNYANLAYQNDDTFIRNIQLWMNSNFGNSKVSLDGFREQAKRFDSDLYKHYEEEAADPRIQQRINELLREGHANPIQDVKVQMLQTILKDPQSVKHFNSLSKQQSVVFLDIETQGLNKELHEITSVGLKQWREIPEGATLSEILDILEDTSSDKLLKAYHTEEYIRKNISDDLLVAMFGDDVTLPYSREAYLEKYIALYGSEHNKVEYSEYQVIEELMNYLDNEAASMHNNVPTIVTHNNNDFDMSFIEARCKNYKSYSVHIDHITSLANKAENTLLRLKKLEKDTILTSESKRIILDSVEKCMRSLSYKDNMRLFNYSAIESGLRRVESGLANLRNSGKAQTDERLAGLVDFFESGQATELTSKFESISKEIMTSTKMFRNNLMVDPYSITLKSLGDEELGLVFNAEEILAIKTALKEADADTIKAYEEVFKERYMKEKFDHEDGEISSFMRLIREKNESGIPPLSYRIFFNETSEGRLFNIIDEHLYSEMELNDMHMFASGVATIINKRMKANNIIELYYEDYIRVIEYIKELATSLESFEKYSYLKYLKTPTTVNEAFAIFYKLSEVIEPKQFSNILSETVSGGVVHLLNNKEILSKVFKDVTSQYFTKYMTDIMRDSNQFSLLIKDLENGVESFEEVADMLRKSEYATLSDQTYLQVYRDFSDFIRDFKTKCDADEELLDRFLKDVADEMDIRRQAMTAQIMENITKSSDDLISHLLYHNQFLIIPRQGSKLHLSQVKTLEKKLSTFAPDKINYMVKDDYVFISLRKGNRIEVVNEEVNKFKFVGDEKIYDAPVYDNIEVDVTAFKTYKAYPELANKYKEAYESIMDMRGDAANGSVGSLHTFGKQKEMYRLLDERFINNALTEDYTCDSRIWHGASFDFTNLGDIEHCWKYRGVNDIDPIMIMKENLDEMRGRVQSERIVLDTWFGEGSEMKLSNLLRSDTLDVEQRLNIIRSMDDHVCVVLKEGKTASGYRIDAVNVYDKLSLEIAEEGGAVFVPYTTYLEMQTMFNEEKFTTTAGKVFAKFSQILKCGQLMFFGTWLNNYVDATIKTIRDTGNVSDTLRYQGVALELIRDYNKVIKHFENMKNTTYVNKTQIKREFDSIQGIHISFDKFVWLDGWFKSVVSGGESALKQKINQKRKGSTNLGLKPGSTKSYVDRRNNLVLNDRLGPLVEQFLDIDEAEISRLWDALENKNLTDLTMSKERFMEIFNNYNLIEEDEIYKWNEMAHQMVQVRSGNMSYTSFMQRSEVVLDNMINGMLKPMSMVEEVVRLGEYLALDAQGLNRSQIFKQIIDTHFNYDSKTYVEKIIELFIPFYTYQKNNLIYWCKQVDENPRMVRYLEHFWGNLSWDSSNVSEEERMENLALRSALLRGNIPLGKSGLMLKTNFSGLSALNYLIGSPQAYLTSLSVPMQYLTRFLMGQFGADSYAVFSEVEFNIKPEEYRNLIPVVGSVWNHFDKALDLFDDDYDEIYRRLSEEGREGWQGVLVKTFSGVFGAVSRYHLQEFDTFEAFQKELEVQGKWYDMNRGKVVALSEKNSIGLNAPRLSFEDKANFEWMYHGKVYDMNKGEWVTIDKFTPGGLNRKFDFSKPGEWEEYCRLRKLYHGEVWDANQNKFVKPEDFIPGMLNDPDATWDEICYYNFKLFGRVYDANRGEFIGVMERYVSGGLNSNDLTWDELSKLQYIIHGKVWNQGLRRWVQVAEPRVVYDFNKDVKPTPEQIIKEDHESIFSKLGIISPVYADTLVQSSVIKSEAPLKDERGRYVLTGSAEHDQKVFEAILSETGSIQGIGTGNNNSYVRYRNGNAGGYSYKGVGAFPKRAPYIKKSYGKPYSSGKNLAGLRMATSNYTAYDEYYNYEYSYRFRNSIKGVADYPQTKLGIDRYMRMREENLLRSFQNKNNYDLSNSHSTSGLSVDQRLNRIKLHWWMR